MTVGKGRSVLGRWCATCLFFAVLALAVASMATPVRAQEDGRAGLVIVTGSGDVITRCVDFAGDSIRGDELLARSGLAVVSDPQSSMGATVCSIEGVGCKYPAQDCFCKCQGSPCVYWSYWRYGEADGWNYSGMGASNTQVRDGAVEGWVWGDGTSGEAPEPPALTFADICTVEVLNEPQVGTVTTPVAAGESEAASALATAGGGASSTELASAASATLVPTSASAPTVAQEPEPASTLPLARNAGAAGLAGAAAIVAVPLLLLALLWWRRR